VVRPSFVRTSRNRRTTRCGSWRHPSTLRQCFRFSDVAADCVGCPPVLHDGSVTGRALSTGLMDALSRSLPAPSLPLSSLCHESPGLARAHGCFGWKQDHVKYVFDKHGQRHQQTTQRFDPHTRRLTCGSATCGVGQPLLPDPTSLHSVGYSEWFVMRDTCLPTSSSQYWSTSGVPGVAASHVANPFLSTPFLPKKIPGSFLLDAITNIASKPASSTAGVTIRPQVGRVGSNVLFRAPVPDVEHKEFCAPHRVPIHTYESYFCRSCAGHGQRQR